MKTQRSPRPDGSSVIIGGVFGKHRGRRCVCALLIGLGLLPQVPLRAWTPGTSSPNAVSGFVVDPLDRRDVLSFHHTIYAASTGDTTRIGWSGNVSTCTEGTTAAVFKDDVLRRINYYRALATLPANITFNTTKSAKAQDAALMISSNGQLSHFPPTSWSCYTAAGADAAGTSNIYLGRYGAAAVDGYILDPGANNYLVGHRRWFLYSRAKEMGTGDIPPNASGNSANAVWVIGNFKAAPTPQFVAWPNRGFVPHALVPARWSLSYPSANFANAKVTMTQGGISMATTIVSRTDDGFGDNTLVWEPVGLPTTIAADTPYQVTVAGIAGKGVPTSYNYTVTAFDPAVLGDAVNVTGTSTPPTSGATYHFNAIRQADQYEVRVATASTADWVEGAEDSPPPHIVVNTTGSYALRQSALFRSGTKAFQLAFPDFNDQSFEITRDLIPTASSALVFYDRCRFATTTSTLSAEISTDGGATWTSLFSRPGVGLSSGAWDDNFISRNISLSAYAGQIVRLRFILRSNGGSITIGTESSQGFFIDDIRVTNASQLVNSTVTTLAGSADSFTLNATTAGAPLVPATAYYLRVRPNVGTHWFPYGPAKIVTAQAAPGYAAWVASLYPSVTGGQTGDHDNDGIRNGIEYAFGLNPTVANPPGALPQFVRAGNNVTLTYTPPAGVAGATYGAQWTRDFVTWIDIPNTGTSGTKIFSVNVADEPRAFFRHHILIAP